MLVLSWTLKNITPEALHASLLQALGPQSPLSKTLSSGALPGLLLIFKRVGCNVGRAEIAVSQQTLKHCVRCHKKYMERNNGRLACQIPHKVSSIPCCDQNSSMCSVDRHTTVASNVAYNGVSLVACGVGALKCLKPTDG
ncbi:hypothetical protein DFP72DRAFT_806337 [Ephemerocybe angulata]|uniref:Uncharacterized protein n=1 Tax=Ephemerocybe angulata TaxID=980116 RepID=A0A8H6I973_9AGAR|nr:hypothetical protein DFP72DRAFT_806337 [Tulosesus angulatus]